MSIEGVPPEHLVLAVGPLVLHLPLVLLLLLALLHHLQQIQWFNICDCETLKNLHFFSYHYYRSTDTKKDHTETLKYTDTNKQRARRP